MSYFLLKMNLNQNIDKNVTFIIFSTNSNKISLNFLTGIYISKENPILIKFDNKIIKFIKKINESNILFNFINLNLKLSENTIPYSIILNAEYLIVFIDLEFENSFSNLQELIDFLNSKSINLKNKILIYGIYKNIEYIQENMTEQNLGDYLDSERIFFDYYKLDFNNIDSIIETYNFFMTEASEKCNFSKEDIIKIEFKECNNSSCYLY